MMARSTLRQSAPSASARMQRRGLRVRHLVCGLLMGGLAASPALADKASAQKKATAQARAIMRDMAKCVVAKFPDDVRRYVLLTSSDPADNQMLQRVADPNCLHVIAGQLRMRGGDYRAALAEQMIRRDLAAWPAIDPVNIAPLAWRELYAPRTVDDRTGKPLSEAEQARQQEIYAKLAVETLMARLGECAVRADPAGALAVLHTDVDQPDELAALKAMAPVFANCVQQGETLAFNRTNLRNGIALSYYRLAYAQTAVAQAGAKP
jgi:hypothetical protein